MSRSLTAFALALVLPLAACSDDDDPSGPDVEASGTYALASVNGEALPYTLLVSEGDSVEVVDGHIELNVDHTFTDSTTFRITEGGTITSEVEVYTGSYSQTGNALTFTPAGGGQYVMSVREDELTQTVGVLVLIYRR